MYVSCPTGDECVHADTVHQGLGLELVKIILLTIPYALASPATGLEQQALVLLDKTDIIASTPHALEALVDPYSAGGEEKPREPASVCLVGNTRCRHPRLISYRSLVCFRSSFRLKRLAVGSWHASLVPGKYRT